MEQSLFFCDKQFLEQKIFKDQKKILYIVTGKMSSYDQKIKVQMLLDVLYHLQPKSKEGGMCTVKIKAIFQKTCQTILFITWLEIMHARNRRYFKTWKCLQLSCKEICSVAVLLFFQLWLLLNTSDCTFTLTVNAFGKHFHPKQLKNSG